MILRNIFSGQYEGCVINDFLTSKILALIVNGCYRVKVKPYLPLTMLKLQVQNLNNN